MPPWSSVRRSSAPGSGAATVSSAVALVVDPAAFETTTAYAAPESAGVVGGVV